MSSKNNKDYKFFIDFIKCLAVILIINSHMDPIYPYPALATGGALGNSLFFIASGYLIRGKRKDWRYFLRFFLKLYIPLYIVTFISGLVKDRSLLSQLIWPTNYWFIGAIVLFYLLYTIIEKIGVFKHYLAFFSVLTGLYIVIYVFFLDTTEWVVESVGLYDLTTCFKLIYYFAIMVTGGFIKDLNINKSALVKARVVYVLSIIAMYSSKYIISRNNNLMWLQFTSQVFAFSFAVAMFIACMESGIVNTIGKRKYIQKAIQYISSYSLDIYLVQFVVIDISSKHFAFPLSWFVAVGLIIVTSSLLHFMNGLIHKGAQVMISKYEREKNV